MCMAGFQDVGSRFTNPETGDLASKSLRRHCYSSVAKTMTERPRFGGKLDGKVRSGLGKRVSHQLATGTGPQESSLRCG